MIIKKDILILGKAPTQGLDDTELTARVQVLSLYYNGSNSFLFANATKIYQFQVKDFEIKIYLLFLFPKNISGDFSVNNKKKTGLNGCVYDFLSHSGSINSSKHLSENQLHQDFNGTQVFAIQHFDCG